MDKELIGKIKKENKGDVRGVVFETDRKYILTNYKEKGLEKVEKILKDNDLEIRYKEIETNKWYPSYLRFFSLLAIKESFGFSDSQMRKVGESAPMVSPIVRLFFNFFVSVKRFAKEIPGFWQKHWTEGGLTVESIDIKKKEMVISLEGIEFYTFFYYYLEGYFESVVKISRPKNSVVTAKGVSCQQRGGNNCYKYLIKWT